MMVMDMKRSAKVLMGFAMPLLLVGCSVERAPRLASAVPVAMKPSVLVIEPIPDGQPASTLVAQFENSLKRALAERSIGIAADAKLRMTMVIAQRPAEIGVTARKDGVPSEPDWLSRPRKHRWLHACHAQRFEATLVLMDPAGPGMVASARGAFDACAPRQAQLDRLAQTLVTALIGT
jgi:hypothetical protein